MLEKLHCRASGTGVWVMGVADSALLVITLCYPNF